MTAAINPKQKNTGKSHDFEEAVKTRRFLLFQYGNFRPLYRCVPNDVRGCANIFHNIYRKPHSENFTCTCATIWEPPPPPVRPRLDP